MCNWQTGKKISSSKMHREKNAKELIPYKSKKVDHVTTKLQSFISTRHDLIILLKQVERFLVVKDYVFLFYSMLNTRALETEYMYMKSTGNPIIGRQYRNRIIFISIEIGLYSM
jgi:hypothetical protein